MKSTGQQNLLEYLHHDANGSKARPIQLDGMYAEFGSLSQKARWLPLRGEN
jgi:hypothetical protein